MMSQEGCNGPPVEPLHEVVGAMLSYADFTSGSLTLAKAGTKKGDAVEATLEAKWGQAATGKEPRRPQQGSFCQSD